MTDPCKPQACAIQGCLTKTGFDESKCSHLIDSLYECCSKFYNERGADARTPCCPVPSLLRLKLEQRACGPLDAKRVR
ncbi:Cx9C motif-containing protein 4, mitochondrial [Lachancea thermotolerans]|uniref:Cx9C motif-containing protein 4, mitochondrial n=1 Tax=Lachancea thermotolerans (strain ATCC 56472 / CBS 6340 / NRRL Y-8284) TaxID=559295 RepID=CMC4_LACTC|nr:KLTH0H02552p [Lachancea thermotolerans CBS 6340]C5E268.1 RecName: Full=Cx9C motif-containing protein 4, mitochondrial [Lachancea thermotolerans CBS 6340]CAR30129.1 KLTH0H02552p [Lachancea thermotolerans CBS 6340]